MRSLKVLLPSAILALGFIVLVPSVRATQAYAKKEKKSCTTCHGKVEKKKEDMVKNLNAVGTCYKDNAHSLATCSAPK